MEQSRRPEAVKRNAPLLERCVAHSKVNLKEPMVILSDSDIDMLIKEPKTPPPGLRPLTRLIERSQHLRKDFEITGASGSSFLLAIRQSKLNLFDFSAILGYRVPGFNTVFRLCRYNGKHRHTNTIEKQAIHDFHIHYATERYQRLGGMKEDSFAMATDRYQTLDTAVQCLLDDCGFSSPIGDSPLFSGKIQ